MVPKLPSRPSGVNREIDFACPASAYVPLAVVNVGSPRSKGTRARLLRVQIKYAGRQPWDCRGVVSLDFTKGGRRNRTYLDHEIGAAVVYVVRANVLVWLGPEHFTVDA